METFIKKAEDLEAVNANFMPPLLDAILGDYNRNVPAARDAEVLNVMATIIGRLGVGALHDASCGMVADWPLGSHCLRLRSPLSSTPCLSLRST